LVLGKINESDATRCQISRLKCTKLDIRWGSAPDTAGGSLQRSPDTLAVFKGRTSKVGRGREGNGREREERGEAPRIFWSRMARGRVRIIWAVRGAAGIVTQYRRSARMTHAVD